MDTDKPPPPSTHLFFCFTSSSSSMKISSRSILSPNRAGYSREPPPPVTLSTSLSRRLSKSRSIRGGASPAMFPVTGKKRGSGFDNPEPSSPKVTCIGQVRVKTRKKHAKNLRTLSRRRKLEHSRSQRQRNNNIHTNSSNNNQRWVHIPMTICEALRTFGSEVSCLFPCRNSCSSTAPMENEKKMGVGSARWLAALQDGDGAGGDDGEEEMDLRNVRRHVFDNLEIVNNVILGSNDEARVSNCVPPKNALLLMRGRSDPVKMEALNSRFWEPNVNINEESGDFEGKTEENGICREDLQLEDEKLKVLDEINDEEHEIKLDLEMKESVEEEKLEMLEKKSVQEEDDEEQIIEINEEENDHEQSMEVNEEDDEEQSVEIYEDEESFFIGYLFEENADENQEAEEEDSDMEDAQEELFEDEDVEEIETGELNIEEIKQFEEENDGMLTQFIDRSGTGESNVEEVKQFEERNVEILTQFTEKTETGESNVEEIKHFEQENEEMFTEFTEISETEESNIEEIKHFEEEIEEMFTEKSETRESKIEKIEHFEQGNDEMLTHFTEKIEEIEEMLMEFTGESETLERENEERENEEREKIESLPECLLLMMYEPKLSMEVSKETWVSSSDFTRRHSSRKKPLPPPPPPPPVESIDGDDESKVAEQPGQTSPSITAPDSMMTMLEQKLVKTMGFEPLVLSRCKSEPMRRGPETCSWQNQLEPPRRASFGVGMAGLAG